jgi:pimeloyl-ACP methyl ester carboxylesterase
MTDLPGKRFKDGTVSAGEFVLDYVEAGPTNAMATIVSLPGSAGLEMSTAKDHLAETYRVIEINPPGWGGKTDLNRQMSQAELGGLLAEAVAKLVKGRYFLIGTSMGGTNALYVAEKVPERVAGIVLEGSMAPSREQDLRMGPMPPGAMEKMVTALESGNQSAYPFPPPHPKKPWSTSEYVAKQMVHRGKMMRWIAPDLAATSAIAAVREQAIPVLALLGDADQILETSIEAAYKAELPKAEFRVIPGGEHDLQNTAPTEFVQLVDDFISRVSK